MPEGHIWHSNWLLSRSQIWSSMWLNIEFHVHPICNYLLLLTYNRWIVRFSERIFQMYDITVAKALCNNCRSRVWTFEFLPFCQKDFLFNFSQILNSLRLYANILFHPCQLKVTVQGQWFEHLVSCLHYVSKMVSSVGGCTEYMLYGLKVSVITSCKALKDIHLTLVTYWPQLRRMRRTHVHCRSLTSHGANDFCSQQPKTCMVALPFYVLLDSILVMLW